MGVLAVILILLLETVACVLTPTSAQPFVLLSEYFLLARFFVLHTIKICMIYKIFTIEQC